MAADATLTKNGVIVTIFTTNFEELYEKKMFFIRKYRTPQHYDAGVVTTIMDPLNIIETFVVRGHITQTDTDTAKQQRTKLRNMIKAGGGATFVYDDISENVNFMKSSIKEDDADEGNTENPTTYPVLLTLVIGVDRGT